MTDGKIIRDEGGIVETVSIEVENGIEFVVHNRYVRRVSGLDMALSLRYHPSDRQYKEYKSKFEK